MTSGRVSAHAVVLRLALGISIEDATELDWPTVLAVASAENCVALCWERGGHDIRRYAPAVVVSQWRSSALAIARFAHENFQLLSQVVRELRANALAPLVLKGHPLAQLLYGTIAVRPMADIDLYIPAERREAASAVLGRLGWVAEQGSAPATQTFRKTSSTGSRWLEIHSRLFGDELPHLPAVPASISSCVLYDESFDVLAHPLLAAYLAVHLLRHPVPPLLWVLELYVLWSLLSPIERAQAMDAARAARVHHYLMHVVHLADDVTDAATGNPEALCRLGVNGNIRYGLHPVWTLTRRAENLTDAVSVLRTALRGAQGTANGTDVGAIARRVAKKLRPSVLIPARTPQQRTYSLLIRRTSQLAIERRCAEADH